MQRVVTHLWLVGSMALLACGCRVTTRAIPLDADSGKPVAFWIQYPDRDEPVVMEAPYAIAVVWQGEDHRFYLFDGAAQRVHRTRDFDTFLRKLDTLPPDSAVQNYTICSAGLAYDMPEGKWDQIQQAVTRRGRRWAVNPLNHVPFFIICTCESDGLRFP